MSRSNAAWSARSAAWKPRASRWDGAELARIGEDFASRLVVLEQQIHGLAGRAFNVGSPKQLGEILFDEMKLPGGRKGKTGAYSTDASVLEEMANQGIDLARRVLDWRQLAKLKSTYVEALASQIDPIDRRVHTSYGMAGHLDRPAVL
jgi:DNA polymerase-1